jgi:hypothetical protein
MLEFIGWDDTVCTEGQFPVADVTIAGPLTGTVDMDYDFTATVVPTQTTQPITYTWQATDQTGLLQTAALTDTITYNWDTSGTKLITVTAANSYNMVTAVHTITVHTPTDLAAGRPKLVTPLPVTAYVPVSFTVAITNLGTVAADGLFFVDLFIDPDIVLTTTIPLSQSVGYVALSNLNGGESRVVTITAPLGFANLPAAHLVYAMVDSVQQLAEPDETNNISPPLIVTDVIPIEVLVPLTAVSLTGAITGEMGVDYAFAAVAAPISATQPVTYIWEASGHAPITQTNGLTDTVAFSWAVTGTQTITVTAVNEAGEVVTAVHTITITAVATPPQHILYLPLVVSNDS